MSTAEASPKPITTTDREVPREHFVQFYAEDAHLIDSVGEFVLREMQEGAASIVIATPAHAAALERFWTRQGLDLSACRDTGQYTLLDAESTLARLMADGWPQASLFQEVIETVVASPARKFPRVVAFGEMVNLLWEEARYSAAIRLEELWNDLLKRHPLALYCGYRQNSEIVPSEMVQSACAQHSRVLPDKGGGAHDHESSHPEELRELREKVERLEREVRQRRAMGHMLANREQELDEFLKNAPVPLHSVGADGRVLWANKAELELLGIAAEQYIGQPIVHFHSNPEAGAKLLKRLLNGESLRNEPAVLRTSDGKNKRVLIDSNALWENGQFLRSRCFTRDVGDEYVVAEARALLAAIVESSDDAVVSKTLDGKISSWNDGAERLFGYSAAEMVGSSILKIIPPELHHEEAKILAKLTEGGRIEHFETRRMRKDGTQVEVSLSVSPVKDASGRVIGASKVARDNSLRKRVEAQLRDMARYKDEFIITLGHELRNPLAPISNVAEMLLLSSDETSEERNMCLILKRQVQQMSRLLDDVMEVSRISRGKIQFRREPVDLLAVISRAVETSRPLIDAHTHRLVLSIPEKSVRVNGDAARLVQAFANILNNAAKYTPDGGEIRLSVESEAESVVLRIRDNGAGIAPELVPHVFELFVQSDQTLNRAEGGLGVGLTLVRQIVEHHGGRISVLSAGVNCGSEFTILLPILKPES